MSFMPVKERDMDMTAQIPIWDRESDTVSWEGKSMPAMTFWQAHHLIKIIREHMEVYSIKGRDEERELLADFLVRKSEELTDLAATLATQAFCEAAGVSMLLERYLYEDHDPDLRLNIKNRLIRIRRILFLDELLGQLYEHQEYLRGRVEIRESFLRIS